MVQNRQQCDFNYYFSKLKEQFFEIIMGGEQKGNDIKLGLCAGYVSPSNRNWMIYGYYRCSYR